jgi:hypothetical protein
LPPDLAGKEFAGGAGSFFICQMPEITCNEHCNEHIGKTVTDHLGSQQSGMEKRM